MKKLLFVVLTVILMNSCKTDDVSTLKKQILNSDIAFSDYSVENGYSKAFIEFADDSAVLLKPNRLPVVGINEIKKLYSQGNSEIVLSWKPSFVDVAECGELGYTYGIWTLLNKKDSILGQGTYLSIWKKQNNGEWKYVLDTGNDGLGN